MFKEHIFPLKFTFTSIVKILYTVSHKAKRTVGFLNQETEYGHQLICNSTLVLFNYFCNHLFEVSFIEKFSLIVLIIIKLKTFKRYFALIKKTIITFTLRYTFFSCLLQVYLVMVGLIVIQYIYLLIALVQIVSNCYDSSFRFTLF